MPIMATLTPLTMVVREELCSPLRGLTFVRFFPTSGETVEDAMNALIVAVTMMMGGDPVSEENILDYDICHEGIKRQLPADALAAYAEICEE